MPLLRETGEAVADAWTILSDDQPVPAEGAVVVSLKRWREEREDLAGRDAPLGVLLPSGALASDVAPDLQRLALVALDFPKFRDGRGFTVARELRERFGYTGEIRAVGHVIADQFPLLLRCGVSTVQVPDTAKLDQWQAALGKLTIAYQKAVAGEELPLSLRRFKVA